MLQICYDIAACSGFPVIVTYVDVILLIPLWNAGRWESLDRSLRRVDAVLNMAARSTGLELDRVCDGSTGGMLGGLTQMPPPPLELRHHAESPERMPDEALCGDAGGVLGRESPALPMEDVYRSSQQEQPTADEPQSQTEVLPRAGDEPDAYLYGQPPVAGSAQDAGIVTTDVALQSQVRACIPSSSQSQPMGSPTHSNTGGVGILTQKARPSPANSPRHTPRAEWSQDEGLSGTAERDDLGLSSREEVAQSSPRHTPRTEWTQDSEASLGEVPQQYSVRRSLLRKRAARTLTRAEQLPPPEQPRDCCGTRDVVTAHDAASARTGSSSPEYMTVSSSSEEATLEARSSPIAGAAYTLHRVLA